MTDYGFELTSRPLTETEEFKEASREELRVLLALITSRQAGSSASLASLAAVSEARLGAALALWEGAGVIRARGKNSGDNLVSFEFDERLERGIVEEGGIAVAKQIRDEKLAELYVELATLMRKPLLSGEEIKRVALLSKQYSLSAEYILTLASFLEAESSLTVGRLVARAVRLAEEGSDTLESLEIYIKNKEARGDEHSEIKALLGIYNRNPSKTELKYFKRWQSELGYSVKIIGEAYDITVLNTGKISLKYMDTLLTDWYENGCKTADECKQRYENRSAELASEKKNADEKRRCAKTDKKQKPRYGDFDPEEALRSAIARSFSGTDET